MMRPILIFAGTALILAAAVTIPKWSAGRSDVPPAKQSATSGSVPGQVSVMTAPDPRAAQLRVVAEAVDTPDSEEEKSGATPTEQFPDVPADFDPYRKKPGEDAGLWIVYRELVLGFKNTDYPARGHVPFETLLAELSTEEERKRMNHLTRSQLRGQLRELNREIAGLQTSWGIELRRARLRQMLAGNFTSYDPASPPVDRIRELEEQKAILHYGPGATFSSGRLTPVIVSKHARLDVVDRQIRALDQIRMNTVRAAVAAASGR